MLLTDSTPALPLAERQELQGEVLSLVVQFIRQLHSGPAGPWLNLGLTMPQLKMLLLVDKLGPVPMNQVAARLHVSVSAATGLIDRLVEQGLAGREHDRRDRRVVRVASTPAGKELLLRLQIAGSERLGQVLGCLSDDDLRRCARVAEALNEAAGLAFGNESLREERPAVATAAGGAEAEETR